MPDVSVVIPTRDRNDELARTLDALGAIPDAPFEVLVIDNASAEPVRTPRALANGSVVRTIRSERNLGAAARNVGAREAGGGWLFMLDDDSAPLDDGFVRTCERAPAGVAAIGARITLPDGSRERGGLPEVIVGCGALIRREAFLAVGGYDEGFGYYAEEYDLCAKLLLTGGRIAYDNDFGVLHRKATGGRDMNEIMRRITRNSAWVELRYAPDHLRDDAVEHVLERYGAISAKEGASAGYERGVGELATTYDRQVSTPMTQELYDRFTGLAHARSAVLASRDLLAGRRVAMVGAGKQAWAVERALAELGLVGPACTLVASERDAQTLVVGTLSPGPMFDALRVAAETGKPVVAPWVPGLPVSVGAPMTCAAMAA